MRKNHYLVILLFFSSFAYAQDVGVTAINSPSTGCDLGLTTVSVDVTNFGTSLTLSTIDISYQLDNGTVVTQSQVFTSFNTNDVRTVAFTVPVNLNSNYGSHSFKAYTDFTTDSDRSNDTTAISFSNYEPSEGGVLAAAATVCMSMNGDTLRVANVIGDVQQWENNTGSGFVPLVVTDTFLAYSNLTTSTTYRVLVKNGTCANDYSNEITITVDTPAVAGSLASSKTVCFGDPGDTLRLTGYEGQVSFWQKDEGSGWSDIANTDDTLIYPVLSTTTKYRAVVSKGVCDADTSNEITITVLPESDGGVLTPMSSSVCAFNNTGTLTLSGKIGDVVRWELSDDNGSTWIPFVKTDTFHTFNDLTTTRQFRVLVQFQTCDPQYSNIATVTVNPAANAGTLQESRQVCAGGPGDTLKLVDYTGSIVKWQSNDASTWVDISNTTDTLTYGSPTATKSYRVIVSNGSCPDDTSNVAVISVVSQSEGGNISPQQSIVCEGENGDDLVLTNRQGSVTRWEISDDNGSTWVPTINTTDTQTYQNLTITRWYRVFVEADGCPSVYSDTATVQVLSKPVGGEVQEDKSICGGTNTDTLILVNHEGMIVKWQSNAGAGWIDIANTKDTLFVSNVFNTTRYRAIVGNGVCDDDTSSEATLTVIATTYGGEIIQSDSVCDGENMGTLILRNHIGDIRWWEMTTNGGVTWNALANEDTTQGYLNIDVNTMYRVLVEGTNCPNDYSDTATITPYLPAVDITAGGPTEFCFGENVVLQATKGYVSYAWSSGESTDSVTASTTGTYTVQVTDTRGCKNKDSVEVTAYELPIANAGNDTTISLGATIALNGSGGTFYSWSPGESLDDSTKAKPLASPLDETFYNLTVTDDNGCIGLDQVRITVLRDYNFDKKNLITPNGDGFNDTWTVSNILPYKNCTVTIVNRYGDVVFEQTGYDNTWDGTNGGSTVSDGTYYYLITCPEIEKVFKGNITLLTK